MSFMDQVKYRSDVCSFQVHSRLSHISQKSMTILVISQKSMTILVKSDLLVGSRTQMIWSIEHLADRLSHHDINSKADTHLSTITAVGLQPVGFIVQGGGRHTTSQHLIYFSR
jgi:hypothetical protein